MTNQQILERDWNAIKGKLQKKWGQLTDSDFPQLRGDADDLVRMIQGKTGEGREAIEQYLQEISGSAASAFGTASAAVRDYSQQAAGQMPPATTKRKTSSAIGRQSRCLSVSEWA